MGNDICANGIATWNKVFILVIKKFVYLKTNKNPNVITRDKINNILRYLRKRFIPNAKKYPTQILTNIKIM